MASVGGGIIGGAGERHLNSLRDFALQAGVAFQIKDDILDYVGGKGRVVGSDILEGKRTLLVVYASDTASAAERHRLLEILNRPRSEKSAQDIAWVHELYQRTHASSRAEQLAEQLIDNALDSLMDLPDTPAKYRFLRLSRHLSRRRA
jgi:geranylgeranyl pyrophosphate synthase